MSTPTPETGQGAKASSITIFDGYVTYTYYLAPRHGRWSIDDIYQAARKVCDSPATPGVKMTADWESLYREEVIAKDGWKDSRNKLLAALAEMTKDRDKCREGNDARDKKIAELKANYLQVMTERDEFRKTIQELGSTAKDREMSLSAKIAGLRRELEELKASTSVVESWMPKPPQNLREDIIRAINCRSAESGSNTPDWILGDFLMASLEAFDAATMARTRYNAIPDDVPATDPPAETPWEFPKHCPVCKWSNTTLANYGTVGKPKWMCHGCAARAIQSAP
jgi:hypothetical protein